MTDFVWTPPRDVSVRSRREFPVDSLPPVLRGFAVYQAEQLQTDPSMVALPAIAAAASACGAAYAHMNEEWSEPSPIWVLTAADPGSRKSAALSAALSPLNFAEKRLVELDSETRPEKEVRKSRAKKNVVAAEKLYEELLGDADAELAEVVAAGEAVNTAAAAAAQVAAEVGVPPKLNVGSYATAEKLHDLLAEHKNILMAVAEGDTMFKNLSPKGGLDRDIFLSAWSMEAHARNLVGRVVQDADHPSLHFSIMVQVKVVAAVLRADDALSDTGFFDRFLTAVPDTSQLQRTKYVDLGDPTAFAAIASTAPAVAAYRDAVVREVNRTLPLKGLPTNWYLAPGGAEVFETLSDEWAMLKKSYTTRSPGALSKLAGQAARLARLFSQLEMSNDPANASQKLVFGGETVVPLSTTHRYPISVENVRRGWDIAWWCFREHEYLFGESLDDDVALAELAHQVIRKARQLADEGETSFSVRRLRRRGLGKHSTVDVTNAVQAAATAGWLQSAQEGANTVWHVHPEIAKWATEFNI
ncbi:DUF3987 domain-containing protein [Mycolicibacter arupensis]|uniref:DUF3987 domain-containing protein n=1 Tax=Mycolicibacter arupensis TaxID=342002 RepID=A0A5C7Y2S4_9MYCO|nr:DUF3987 domain-containing protein [Mycolicibacter arupensis]TXI55921.1 MAG: DUF3987 domain-containing protein [Mycolicibacter arupensis]